MSTRRALVYLTLGWAYFVIGVWGIFWALLQDGVKGAQSSHGGDYYTDGAFLMGLITGPPSMLFSIGFLFFGFRGLYRSPAKNKWLIAIGYVFFMLSCASTALFELIFYI